MTALEIVENLLSDEIGYMIWKPGDRILELGPQQTCVRDMVERGRGGHHDRGHLTVLQRTS
jgi:hypothetical protein